MFIFWQMEKIYEFNVFVYKYIMSVGIAGLGFVGGAMYRSFTEKGQDCVVYDKFKDGGIGLIQHLLQVDMIFMFTNPLLTRKTRIR